jgi:hypothetical protein
VQCSSVWHSQPLSSESFFVIATFPTCAISFLPVRTLTSKKCHPNMRHLACLPSGEPKPCTHRITEWQLFFCSPSPDAWGEERAHGCGRPAPTALHQEHSSKLPLLFVVASATAIFLLCGVAPTTTTLPYPDVAWSKVPPLTIAAGAPFVSFRAER